MNENENLNENENESENEIKKGDEGVRHMIHRMAVSSCE